MESVEIPYALIPDYEGYPMNAPLHTFEVEMSADKIKELARALADPKNGYRQDEQILKSIYPDLYESYLSYVKEAHPYWEDFEAIEIYCPSICHIMAEIIKRKRAFD